jgi:hypothetical protein
MLQHVYMGKEKLQQITSVLCGGTAHQFAFSLAHDLWVCDEYWV